MDPLSLAAGIAGLVSLTDLVVTKGRKYLKAVQECEDEVLNLILETDIFCGAIERLARAVEENEEEEEEEYTRGTRVAKVPDYVVACQRTLNEILNVLVSFERKASRAALASIDEGADVSHAVQPSLAAAKKNIFRRLSRSDLKWPWSKSKTMELLASLERHKSTCILALSTSELMSMRDVLEETRVIGERVVEMEMTQKKMLDVNMEKERSREAKIVLDWLSVVNPAYNHQVARGLWQEGTGRWIFDLPEYIEWVDSPNSALWIYGIPGAGKTILTSLIVEELFSTKTSGVAYFYCTYKNVDTQNHANILGSLIRQLALQSSEALIDASTFYKAHHPKGKPPSRPTAKQLGSLLQSLSKNFAAATIVVDGLDECGSAPGIDRTELVRVLSSLHDGNAGSVRSLIVSRKEGDIHEALASFPSISIAARSSDLQLFVASKVQSLKVREEKLRGEIIEALTQGADGMFQWVKCQLDYLSGLPNDRERRQALKELPPDLPATYIRLLERFEWKYPPQTQKLIQRTFKWLILQEDPDEAVLTLEGLAHAISIEADHTNLDLDVIPSESDIIQWCGSLVRVDSFNERLEFSHFSVREFLTSDKDSISSQSARKYLVDREVDMFYLAETCLLYLSMDNFRPILRDVVHGHPVTDLDARFPFYRHAAICMHACLLKSGGQESEPASFSRFLTAKRNFAFSLWDWYIQTWGESLNGSIHAATTSPIHLAASCLLVHTTQRLLEEGAHPSERSPYDGTALHLAIHPYQSSVFGQLYTGLTYDVDSAYVLDEDSRRLKIVNLLVEGGCDIDAAGSFTDSFSHDSITDISPLCLAFLTAQPALCSYLMSRGASLSATAGVTSGLHSSLEVVLQQAKEWEPDSDTLEVFELIKEIFQSASCTDPSATLTDLFQTLQLKYQPYNGLSEQDLLTAIHLDDIQVVLQLLEEGADATVCSVNGRSALSHAVASSQWEIASVLWKYGADVHEINKRGDSAMISALAKLGLEEVLKLFAPSELSSLSIHERRIILQNACSSADKDTLLYVLSISDVDEMKSIDGCPLVESLPVVRSPEIARILLEHSLLSHGNKKELALRIIDTQPTISMDLGLLYADIHELYGTFSFKELETYSPTIIEGLLKHDLLPQEDVCKLLHLACKRDQPDLLRVLLSKGYEDLCPDENGDYVIHRASTYPYPATLKILLEHKFEVDKRNRRHETALHIASGLGLKKNVQTLIGSEANVNVRDHCYRTPLHYAVRGPSYRLAKLLIKGGADPNIKDSGGETPLHLAVKANATDTVRYLVYHGSDPYVKDLNNEQALHAACERGIEDFVELLLSCTEDSAQLESVVNSEGDRYGMPLYAAAERGHHGIVKMLLDAGAEVDKCGVRGSLLGPALFVACAYGHGDVVKTLLSHGAKVKVSGAKFETAFDVAKAFKKIHVLEILKTRDLFEISEDIRVLKDYLQQQNHGKLS